ncbi:5'-nucleotidase [Rhodovulum sp. PH10]|uniref:bifunctional metallophosphatase/5'-nucleotidase n=1 Tax=Rhodovulum sp. PH10 TaxID=1187851 RepID=UPI00027C2804|nr:bifunctional UDP-sugar hydrolase/5'-nucleotidase [Rhodovulum sp. PH10]EJW10699.1 5'-nucleotidase [Rhodovulum sp. PH10]
MVSSFRRVRPLPPFLAVLALLASLLVAPPAQAARLTFVLVNDIYRLDDQVGPDGAKRGGMARLAAVVKAERAKAEQGAGEDAAEGERKVLFVHAGDMLSPSLLSGLDQGAHMIALTNDIAPDVFVPGNHEFDFGKAVFFARMAEAKFPRLAANLRAADGTPLPGFADHRMVEVDGVRIGLVGLAFDGTPQVSSSEDLVFRPAVATLREEAGRLRAAGADLIVAVVHAEREQQRAMLATGVVDLVLGGHNHDLLVNFDERGVLAESAHDALYVVAVDLDLAVETVGKSRKVRWWPRFRVIDTADVMPDPAMATAVAAVTRDLDEAMRVPLATLGVEWDSRGASVRSRETAIGDVFADAIRESAGADAAILNGGGIRGDRVYPAGSAVTRSDVLAELPFGNRLVTVTLTGAALTAALENGFSKLPAPSGRFPQISGLSVVVDPAREPGRRVVALAVGGVPVDPAKSYKVAVNDYLARGGDGYTMLRDAPRRLAIDDAPLLANAVMVHLRRLGRILAGPDGRIAVR